MINSITNFFVNSVIAQPKVTRNIFDPQQPAITEKGKVYTNFALMYSFLTFFKNLAFLGLTACLKEKFWQQ
ncbi:MAG: hypothetical protein HWD59_09570 [Coxiellaceae bacterium]|nr:MAG: hypothetical protein HWD59_09570 [Coxiellaceae bacterium]